MKKSNKGDISFSKVIRFSVYALLAVYAAITLASQQNQLATLEKYKAEYAEKIKKAQQQTEQNKQDELARSSDAFIEKMARDKLGLVKDNERIFIDGASR